MAERVRAKGLQVRSGKCVVDDLADGFRAFPMSALETICLEACFGIGRQSCYREERIVRADLLAQAVLDGGPGVLGAQHGVAEAEDEADMDMDILSYLSAVRQEKAFLHDQYPCAHVRESSTVGHALKLLAKTGFHRVFVVDNDGRPVGVISVTDIVKFVVDSAQAMQTN